MRGKRALSIWIASLCLCLAGVALGADTYQIDPVHSSVGFAAQHLVISHVKGNFKEFSGTIQYDESDITRSSVAVTIKAPTINTENEKRDAHLKSPDFLDVQKYPVITFQSTRIEKRGDGYVAVGQLTIRGVTKEVALPFAITGKIKDPMGKTRMGAQATLVLNRRDYGLNWSKTMDNGGLVVGNDVKIELNVEAVKN